MFKLFFPSGAYLSGFLSLVLFMADAQALNFSGLSDDQFKNLSREFSAIFSHRTITGAKAQGRIFGFELSLPVSLTSTPQIHSISGGSGFKEFPTLGGLVSVSVPYGVTFEAFLFPNLKQNDISFSGNSLGIRWDISSVMSVLPLNVALKAAYSQVSFSFKNNSPSATVDQKTNVTEISVYLSPKLPVLEPYVGLGYVQGRNQLSSNPSVFSDGSTSKAVTNSSFKGNVGVLVRLPGFILGAEYVNLMGTSGYGAKLGIAF